MGLFSSKSRDSSKSNERQPAWAAAAGKIYDDYKSMPHNAEERRACMHGRLILQGLSKAEEMMEQGGHKSGYIISNSVNAMFQASTETKSGSSRVGEAAALQKAANGATKLLFNDRRMAAPILQGYLDMRAAAYGYENSGYVDPKAAEGYKTEFQMILVRLIETIA